MKQTEKDLFSDTIKVAAFVGLGAFFVTNQIPSAFELSIFTLEIISLTSPLTLDRIILSSKHAVVPAKTKTDVTEEVKSNASEVVKNAAPKLESTED